MCLKKNDGGWKIDFKNKVVHLYLLINITCYT